MKYYPYFLRFLLAGSITLGCMDPQGGDGLEALTAGMGAMVISPGQLAAYSDSEEEDAPHYPWVYNHTKVCDTKVINPNGSLVEVKNELPLNSNCQHPWIPTPSYSAGLSSNPDDYRCPNCSSLAEALKDDAEKICRATNSEPDYNPTFDRILTVLCVALQDMDGYIKQFVFTNLLDYDNSICRKEQLLNEAHKRRYHVVQAQQSHAEGALLQFLQERPRTYTHIVAMGCSKPTCSDCAYLLGSHYTSLINPGPDPEGSYGKSYNWRTPPALEEVLHNKGIGCLGQYTPWEREYIDGVGNIVHQAGIVGIELTEKGLGYYRQTEPSWPKEYNYDASSQKQECKAMWLLRRGASLQTIQQRTSLAYDVILALVPYLPPVNPNIAILNQFLCYVKNSSFPYNGPFLTKYVFLNLQAQCPSLQYFTEKDIIELVARSMQRANTALTGSVCAVDIKLKNNGYDPDTVDKVIYRLLIGQYLLPCYPVELGGVMMTPEEIWRYFWQKETPKRSIDEPNYAILKQALDEAGFSHSYNNEDNCIEYLVKLRQ